MKASRVTDTALLHYLRIVAGFDVERVRKHIAAQLHGTPQGTRKRHIGGIEYIIGEDGAVIGVYAGNTPEPRALLFDGERGK